MNTSARIGVTALLMLAVLGVPHPADLAPDRPEAAPPKPTGAQEVDVVAVMVDQSTQQPAVLLQGVTPPRPLTHDLFLTLFGRLNVTLTRVVITDLRDDIFYAIVYLNAGGPELQLDARPSDAIALAIRAKVPVLVEERVFEKAGNTAPPRRPSI